MEYKIVTLEPKTAAGIQARVSNSDPQMPEKIGAAWQRFFGPNGYGAIPGKAGVSTLGLYTNYENGDAGAYDLWVCCEVNAVQKLPENIQYVNISGGKYAEFLIFGDEKETVLRFWQELWAMPLDRRFDCDFEEYRGKSEDGTREIHIFISIR